MINNLNNFSGINEILPFITQYSGTILVIKYGGAAMQDEFLQLRVIRNICFLYSLGFKIILVHGGGPFINKCLHELKITPKFDKGIRITDSKTVEVAEMVLSGQVNKKIVSLFNQHNIPSIGISGKDNNLAIASPMFHNSNNFVGKISIINNGIINMLLDNKYIPVISSIASDLKNQTYNINADTFAGAIAESLDAESLVLLTDTHGIMIDINDPSTLMKSLNFLKIDELKNKSIISGGMIPKVDCCINALKAGVKSVHIINGNSKDALLYELLTNDRIGSKITIE